MRTCGCRCRHHTIRVHTLTIVILTPSGDEIASYTYRFDSAADFRASLPAINDRLDETPFGPAFMYQSTGVKHTITQEGEHTLSSTVTLVLEPDRQDF